ncbi:fimbria/pilus periplasmic chaperone [Pseudomonas mucidolens]|uniref:Fimbrial chaperone protein n=1 Tax=Pseudomonas mucidolens TaxID=46679 RepID=A0A1H2N962_9PSED|nr:fimbria/pilus periplasmic chaperone [Pseudomonas mucidolens]SDV02017.1 fimbrial chaperone protein [Pseudomonas mucidolens]SQH32387.1 molecular chaperone [Pseudomonas mucidolens]
MLIKYALRFRNVTAGLIVVFGSFYTLTAQAGGVALGATRVVYPAGAKQVSMAVSNSDKKNRFLIQSWVDDVAEKKSSDFVVTPPLFVSKPKSENTLRIMYVGADLPKDRESVFWLNSKAIPAVERDDVQDKNVLQIAILSRVKLFVRPANLPSTAADAPGQLKFSRQGEVLKIENPSPYYVSLVSLAIGTRNLPNTMVSPMSNSSVSIPDSASGAVSYQTVNDYGAITPVTTVPLK